MDFGMEGTALIHKNMPLTRRRILMLLKEKGELTADELAGLLGISAVAVRRHLTKLESDHLVTYKEVQRGMGRPSYVYELGEAAASFFPRRYEELAVNVLETIRALSRAPFTILRAMAIPSTRRRSPYPMKRTSFTSIR